MTLACCSPQVFAANTEHVEATEVMTIEAQALRREQVGTKTDTPLANIPQSIVVIDMADIQAQQRLTVSEALRLASSVQGNLDVSTPNVDNTRIRGFAAEQLLDGFSQYYNPGDRESLASVGRIAVLKGSNGLLYTGGAGTPVGGVILLQSLQPEDTPIYRASIRGGEHQFLQTMLDVSQPISATWSARTTAEFTRTQHHVQDLQQRRFNISPSVRWESGEKSLIVRGKVSRWRQKDYQGLPATGTIRGEYPLATDLFIGPDDLPESTSYFHGVTAHWRQTLDALPLGEWQLTVAGRVAESGFDQFAQTLLGYGLDFGADRPWIDDPDLAQQLGFGKLPFALYNAALQQDQQEASVQAFASHTWENAHAKHTLLVGIDASRYADEGFLAAEPVLITNDFGSRAIAIVDLMNPSFQPFVMPDATGAQQEVINTLAGVYAQWQWDIGPWHVLAGARVAHVEIDFTRPDRRDVTRDIQLLPRVGAVYDVAQHWSVFASYSEGLRGQPFAQFSRAPKAEASQQVEFGLRYHDDDISLSAAWFDIQRDQVTVPDPDGFLGSVAEGEQRSQGIDIDSVWDVADAWRISANYAYTDASIENDRFAYARPGDALAGVPEHAGRLWLQYMQAYADIEWTFGLGANAQSASRVSQRNAFDVPGFWRVDMSVMARWQAHQLSLSLNNLLDHAHFIRLGYFGGRVAPADGLAVSLAYQWQFDG